MRRFALIVAGYLAVCLLAIAVILIRGDGPHPRIVALYPPNGDRYWPGGYAEITFSQEMDQSSVERGLVVSPGTQGQGVWYGNTLNLQPDGDWKPGVTYHISFQGTVTDSLGRPLPTPVSFWFRVHRVGHLEFCPVHGVRNVCERLSQGDRPITRSPTPVQQYALSPDRMLLAYIRRDTSGLAHLFLIDTDGNDAVQLTRGRAYADSSPYWTPGDTGSVTYDRRPVTWHGGQPVLGKPRLWNIGTDGSNNAPL
jgi:hypothetical protein